jgi:hypothetical protein
LRRGGILGLFGVFGALLEVEGHGVLVGGKEAGRGLTPRRSARCSTASSLRAKALPLKKISKPGSSLSTTM